MPKTCPETGEDLTGKDPVKWAIHIWGVTPDKAYTLPPDAQKRYKVLVPTAKVSGGEK